MSISPPEQAPFPIEAISGAEQNFEMLGPLQKYVRAIECLEEMKTNTAEEIERLWDKKRNIDQYISHRYALAKDEGFDPETMKTTIRRRATTAVEVDDPRDYLDCPDSLFKEYEAALELERLYAFRA